MGWSWTGLRRDADGNLHRTGFEWTCCGLRVTGFALPGKSFDVCKKRLCIEFGRFHGMFTWEPEEKQR